MVAGNWLNTDGLYLEFGTTKATAETGGSYSQKGAFRELEYLIDCTALTTTAAIQSFTGIFPSGTNIQIESVVTEVLVAVNNITSLSVGLIQDNQSTKPTNGDTAFISALAQASIDTAGKQITMVTGSTSAGNYVGAYQSASLSNGSYYVTAKIAGATATTGLIKVRIRYVGVGTITQ